MCQMVTHTKKKEYQTVAIKMEQKVYDRLCSYCESEYRTKTATIELALVELFDKHDKVKGAIQDPAKE